MNKDQIFKLLKIDAAIDTYHAETDRLTLAQARVSTDEGCGEDFGGMTCGSGGLRCANCRCGLTPTRARISAEETIPDAGEILMHQNEIMFGLGDFDAGDDREGWIDDFDVEIDGGLPY